jgi:hypothetical protein
MASEAKDGSGGGGVSRGVAVTVMAAKWSVNTSKLLVPQELDPAVDVAKRMHSDNPVSGPLPLQCLYCMRCTGLALRAKSQSLVTTHGYVGAV